MAPLLHTLRVNESWRSLARFLVVGTLGTLIDFSLFAFLHLVLGLPALPANILSYSAGIINNYLLHRAWTYAARPKKALVRQFAQFAAVSLSALALNSGVVLILTPWMADAVSLPGAPALLAKLCAVGVGLAWNFLINHFWIFKTES